MIYVLSDSNAIKLSLQLVPTCRDRTLVLSLRYSAFISRKDAKKNTKDAKNFFATLRYLVPPWRDEKIYGLLHHFHYGSFRFGKNDDRKKISSKNGITVF